MERIERLNESDLNRIVKRVLSEGTLSSSLRGGWIGLTDGTTDKKGCVKFVKFEKEDGKWTQVDSWAQGVTDHSGNTTKATLGIPLPIKFNFSWLIRAAVPDSLEKITLPTGDVQSMFSNWKSGNSFVKTIYAADGAKVDSEDKADTKFKLYFGGPTVNSFCKSEWG